MGVIAQAAAAVAGTVASVIGGSTQANAQGNMANAQLSAESAMQAQGQTLTAPTTQELLLTNQQLTAQTQNLTRQQQLLAAVDPALMEAGQQALALMRGQNAPTLGPLQEQQKIQRDSLIQQLTAEMGPNALSSTSGQDALRRFDMASQAQTAQAQQSYLGTLLGSAQYTENQANPLSTIQSMQGTMSGLQSQQGMQVNALMGTSVVPYAGAPYVRSNAMGNMLSNFGNNLSSAGTGGIFNPGKGATPSQQMGMYDQFGATGQATQLPAATDGASGLSLAQAGAVA